MRPTVEEQLEGSCRILETVVAPAVAEPYARTILGNLIANLRHDMDIEEDTLLHPHLLRDDPISEDAEAG